LVSAALHYFDVISFAIRALATRSHFSSLGFDDSYDSLLRINISILMFTRLRIYCHFIANFIRPHYTPPPLRRSPAQHVPLATLSDGF
jgi:hypothetical protein